MKKTELKEGDILQINPENGHKWGGFYLVVTEPKSWGAQGYLLSPFEFEAVKYKGIAYARIKFEDMEFVGHAFWRINFKDDEEELEND